jgi:hypothetical protein
MYNMLFGTNKAAPVLLAVLGITADRVPRYRDCFIDGENIVIHTRTGGGNREWYESVESCRLNYPEMFDGKDDTPNGPWNDDLRALPTYIRDEDDDFDCTYANFYFAFPVAFSDDLKALSSKSDTYKPSEKWAALFAALGAEK